MFHPNKQKTRLDVELERKSAAQISSAMGNAISLLATGYECDSNSLSRSGCSVLNDVTQKQGQDFGFSLLKVGIHTVLA